MTVPYPLSYARYAEALRAQAAAVADLVGAADPDLRVPTCPDWTLAQLTRHLGRAHRWAGALVAQRATAAVDSSTLEDAELPRDAEGRAEWVRAGATRLIDAVREVGPDTPVWTWTPDGKAGFWLRRMTHETVVHRIDVVLALGGEPVTGDLEPDLAADGISEWLGILSLPAPAHRPDLAALRGEGQVLHFHATDEGLGQQGEWMVVRGPEGVSCRYGHGKGDVAVRGPADRLLAVLVRRSSPAAAGLEVLGDAGLLDHWLEHTRF